VLTSNGATVVGSSLEIPQKAKYRAGLWLSIVCLLSMHEALDLIPSTVRRKKKRKEKSSLHGITI
jgi:hypothetical protein